MALALFSWEQRTVEMKANSGPSKQEVCGKTAISLDPEHIGRSLETDEKLEVSPENTG